MRVKALVAMSLSPTELSRLDGRSVVVRSLRPGAQVRTGTLRVHDAAGDQEGPIAFVVFDGTEQSSSQLALDTATIRILLQAAGDAPVELTVDEA